MQDITQGNDVGAPAGGASQGGAGQHAGEGAETERREGERERAPAEGPRVPAETQRREPPTREAGLNGSRAREMERYGSQETETEPASERGLGPSH
ncbi:MAG: hypothetical protein MUF07_01505 [Steroidobacteraceae bacterium]|jgi:hypothetical protein|nr:hypothetical protein [Steroidobacteraceae bacterium]